MEGRGEACLEWIGLDRIGLGYERKASVLYCSVEQSRAKEKEKEKGIVEFNSLMIDRTVQKPKVDKAIE